VSSQIDLSTINLEFEFQENNPMHLYLDEITSRYNTGERNFANVHARSDLVGGDLRGIDLRGATLQAVSLRESNLEGANLSGANITGSSLRSANLAYADLSRANFCREPSYPDRLMSSHLSYANLEQANLTEADLRGAKLDGAKLRYANLQRANLSQADLRGADLTGANLKNVNLSGCNLCHADLTDAQLSETSLEGAKLAGATMPDGTINQHGTLEVIKQKIGPLKRLAWKPLTKSGDGKLTSSKFAGTPWLAVDETWPICPHCQEPMQFFLQLNLEQLPQALERKFGNGLLQMFYCTSDAECDIDNEGWSAFSSCQFLRIVQADEKRESVVIPEIQSESSSKLRKGQFPPKLIVEWQKVNDYPDWLEAELHGGSITYEELVKIATDKTRSYPSDLQDFSYMDKDNRKFSEGYQRCGVVTNFMIDVALLPFGDKLAGWPHWVQSIEYPNCPVCSKLMDRLVFEFASDDNVPFLWGDVGVGYILQCPDHVEQLAFLWQCS
jgi:uncharacterized protein YjbI with pentapeptide repeats/uncharacterized protein YwqG